MTSDSQMFDCLIEDIPAISPSLAKRQKIAKTQADITALINAIEHHGLSPALLAFANHDGVLSKHISSFDNVKIVADLKAIKLTPGQEGFNLGVFKEIVTAITIIKAAVSAYKAYNEWKEDRESHIATVVPFDVLSRQLKASGAIDSVAEKATATLPKTKEEYESFVKQIVQSSSSLSALGVHVSLVNDAPHIAVDDLPQAQKNNIESLGYRSSTIIDLSNQVAQASDDATQHLNFMITGLDESKLSEDEEEKKWQMKAWYMVADIVDTATRRLLHLVKLAEKTIKSISPFYKAS